MKTRIHAIAGVIGFLALVVFWTSTVVSEAFGSYPAITWVKNGILWGMILLIPSLATAGWSGFSLGQGRSGGIVPRKRKRMSVIALNGLMVLVPSAVYLALKANANAFDTMFITVQGIELIAGAINITLMGLNIRDGLRLTGRFSQTGVSTVTD